MRQLPNLITVLRILLVAPLIAAIARDAFGTALLLFVAGGLSDGLDGFLARRFGWQTRLGAILDPLADKLLLLTCYLLLGWKAEIPSWLVVAVILRDLVIVGGGVAYQAFIGHVQMAPTVLSKLNTALQVSLVVVVMFSLWRSSLAPGLREFLIYVVLASTVLSGLNYMWVWGRKAYVNARGG